jgi:hypothetical protein
MGSEKGETLQSEGGRKAPHREGYFIRVSEIVPVGAGRSVSYMWENRTNH